MSSFYSALSEPRWERVADNCDMHELDGKSVPSIDNWTFANSPQLKKIVLPSMLSELGYKVFENSNNIDEISFPNGEEKSQGGRYRIADGYLYDAFGKRVLKVFSDSESIEIPDGVKYLDRLCFAGRKNLKKVSLPSSVKSMEVPFAECDSISEIVVSDDNELYAVKDNCLYEKVHGILERGVSSEKEFTVPDFIKEIRAGVFPSCVEKINIPDSVKKNQCQCGRKPSLEEADKQMAEMEP